MSIYDVSAEQGLVHLHQPPYMLLSSITDSQRIGHAILHHPSQPDDHTALMLELTDRGNLYCTGVKLIDESPASSDLYMLEDSASNAEQGPATIERFEPVTIGAHEGRNCREVSLQPAYERGCPCFTIQHISDSLQVYSRPILQVCTMIPQTQYTIHSTPCRRSGRQRTGPWITC